MLPHSAAVRHERNWEWRNVAAVPGISWVHYFGEKPRTLAAHAHAGLRTNIATEAC